MNKTALCKRGILASAAIVAVAGPSLAFAATPKKGKAYVGKQIEFRVATNGKSLTLQGAGYCDQTAWYVKKVSIKSSGKFSYSGRATKPAGVHVTVKGDFVTTKKATGTIKVTPRAKASFVAKLSHSGQG